MATPADLEALAEGHRLILQAERDQLAVDLDEGLRPFVCLSGPGERPRLVRITSRQDLHDRRLPWAALSRR